MKPLFIAGFASILISFANPQSSHGGPWKDFVETSDLIDQLSNTNSTEEALQILSDHNDQPKFLRQLAFMLAFDQDTPPHVAHALLRTMLSTEEINNFYEYSDEKVREINRERTRQFLLIGGAMTLGSVLMATMISTIAQWKGGHADTLEAAKFGLESGLGYSLVLASISKFVPWFFGITERRVRKELIPDADSRNLPSYNCLMRLIQISAAQTR